jgi:hypothetical protein
MTFDSQGPKAPQYYDMPVEIEGRFVLRKAPSVDIRDLVDIQLYIKDAVQECGGILTRVVSFPAVRYCEFRVSHERLPMLERKVARYLRPLGYRLEARFDPIMSIMVVQSGTAQQTKNANNAGNSAQLMS